MLDGGKAGLTRESETRAAQRVTVEKVITGFKVKNCDQQKMIQFASSLAPPILR